MAESRREILASTNSEGVGACLQEGANSGAGDTWGEEPGSAGSHAQGAKEYSRDYHWGVPLGYASYVVSILYFLLGSALVITAGDRVIPYLQVRVLPVQGFLLLFPLPLEGKSIRDELVCVMHAAVASMPGLHAKLRHRYLQADDRRAEPWMPVTQVFYE